MAPLVGVVFSKHIPKSRSLIGLKMNNKSTKCLIFLFKIPKDSKDFFHKCRHDHEHREI
jgi:hypothetical protein